MRAERRHRFNDWSGGHYSSLGAAKAGQMSPFKYWAENLQVYVDGTLGPRPGFKEVSTWTQSAAIVFRPVTMHVTATSSFYTLNLVFATVGSRRIEINRLTGAVTTTTGLSTGDPSLVGPQVTSTQALFGGLATASYFQPTSATLITGGPLTVRGQRHVLHKQRLYSAADAASGESIYYSDFQAPTTVPVTSVFRVGNFVGNNNVVGMWSIGNETLLICTDRSGYGGAPGGSVGDWWALIGQSVEAGASVVYLGPGQVPAFLTNYSNADAGRMAALDGDKNLWFLGGRSLSVVVRSVGDEVAAFDYLRCDNGVAPAVTTLVESPSVSYGPAMYAPQGESIVLPYSNDPASLVGGAERQYLSGGLPSRSEKFYTGIQAWERHNGVWVHAPYFGSKGATLAFFANYLTFGSAGERMFVTAIEANNAGTATYRTYARDMSLNRPANTSDLFSAPTEALVGASATDTLYGQVRLPLIEAQGGKAIRVRRVEIDLNYWNAAGYSTPQLTCYARTSGFDKDPTLAEVEVQGVLRSPVSNVLSNILPAGQVKGRRRVVFDFGAPVPGGAIEVILSDIKSVAFDSVDVFVEELDSGAR